jgi:mannose-6-phosphate isomerase-like protein (cupin superfamily)
MFVWLLTLLLQATAASTGTPPVAITFISAAEIEKVMAEQPPGSDQPIKASSVFGGQMSVASVDRHKPDTIGRIHNTVTETYYIVKGSGTLITGGTLADPKPVDLTAYNVGLSLQGRPEGGERRQIGPGDIIVIPAGTAHTVGEVNEPLTYLVFRFAPQ